MNIVSYCFTSSSTAGKSQFPSHPHFETEIIVALLIYKWFKKTHITLTETFAVHIPLPQTSR